MTIRKIIKFIFILFGFVIILYSLVLSSATRFGLENVVMIIIGLAALFYALFWQKISSYTTRGFGRALKYIFYAGVSIFLLSFIIALITMFTVANSSAISGADAAIVLGCGLRGSKVSLVLAARLNKAYEYALNNQDTIIIVTGGQGPGEDVTEASAMKEYLKHKGIPENRILLEEASSNTKENMLLSKIVLDSYFNNSDYTCVVITSNFHMLRSLEYAKIMNLNADGLSSKIPFYLMPSYCIREYLALIKLYIFRM